MEVHFFKTGFQFESYINERLLEVKDEGERRALKEVMKDTLIPFYEHAEASYRELEMRLTNSQRYCDNRYEIITGVERRDRIDITEDAMVPMQYADMNEIVVDAKEMQECIMRGKTYRIMKVFLAADYNEIIRIESERRRFKGIVRTDSGEYPAQIIMSKNTSYQKQIADLYSVFEENGLEWNTVCAPYLGKFFDVHIKETQCPETEEIIGITIDFEEYEKKIIYDLVPMWNVRILEENTSAYPDFAFDQIHYEHCVYKSRLKENRDYLVCAHDKKIWEIFRQDGDLHIICEEEEPARWKLMEIGYDAKKKNYALPVYGNYKEKKSERCIHTIAEIKKFIMELGYEGHLQLISVKQNQEVSREQKMTYSMDDFLEDEIRTGTNRKNILFTFRPTDKENYLNKDLMSYLVSRIQWQLPEFECIGELE